MEFRYFIFIFSSPSEPPPLANAEVGASCLREIGHRIKPPKRVGKGGCTFSSESCDWQIRPLLNQDKLHKGLLIPCGSVPKLLLQPCQLMPTVVDTLVCVLQSHRFSQTVLIYQGTGYCVPRLYPCGLCNRRSNGSFGC